MPYFSFGGGEGGGGGTWEPPALIGTGPPGDDPTGHGKIYVDSATNQTFVNVNGQWNLVSGTEGTPGQPRFTGAGAPNDTALADAVLGDLYLDTVNGVLYKKVS